MDQYRRLIETLTGYKIEIGLLTVAALIALTSFFLFQAKEEPSKKTLPLNSIEIIPKDELMIDIGGAVTKPGVYMMSGGSRVRDALSKAGGFSQEVDIKYISRTLNQARALSDQEKIYIPSREDSITQALSTPLAAENHDTIADLTNINLADEEELDSLPGIGPSTISKILKNRPYEDVQDLIDKKVIGPAVFESIQPLITTQN